MKSPLPKHLTPAWGILNVDPRDKPAFCYRQSLRTPMIPWHNGLDRCIACGKDLTHGVFVLGTSDIVG